MGPGGPSWAGWAYRPLGRASSVGSVGRRRLCCKDMTSPEGVGACSPGRAGLARW
jgi:hypothetical protein